MPQPTITFRDLSHQLAPGTQGIEVHIMADFAVQLGNQVLFHDEDFPVVDFAMESQVWAATQFKSRLEMQGLVLEPSAGHCRFAGEDFVEAEVVAALDTFYKELRHQLQSQYGFDLDALYQRGERIPLRDLQ